MRLRQQYPRNYRVSEQISTEFENIIRYLNAAEYGNRTLAELLGTLFNEEGAWAGPVEFRRNLNGAVQVRVGSYTDPEKGWSTLFHLDDVRGLPGANYIGGNLAGAMLESTYTSNGLILLNKVKLDDGAIPQAKVAGLISALAAAAKISVGSGTPTSPVAGQLWLDTGIAPNQLKYYNGVSWLATTPQNYLPSFSSADANKYLRVSPNGLGLEFTNVDLTSRISIFEKGAAHGVATLDANGRIPETQLPTALANAGYFMEVATPGLLTYKLSRVFGQRLTLQNIALKTASGSCGVQLVNNNVTTGPIYTANSSQLDSPIAAPIVIDATASSKWFGFAIITNSSAAALEVAVSGVVSA